VVEDVLEIHSSLTPNEYNIQSIYMANSEDLNRSKEKYPELQYGHYSTHSRRDTYISLYVQNKASMKNILTWVGQSSYRIMDTYIKLTPESQKAEVNSVFYIPLKKKN
jgi:hypothetical protein